MRRTAATLLAGALLAAVWLVAARADPAAAPARPALPGGRRVVDASFDSAPLGLLSATELARQFEQEGTIDASGLSRSRVVPDESGAGRVLRVDLPAGTGGGAQWEVPLPGSYGRACLAYRVRFGPGFEFSRGGKLPGLAGVVDGYSIARAAGGDDPDETPPDEGPDGENAWSSRMMWRERGAAVTYLYAPDWNAKHEYGEDKPWGRRFEAGRFHTVETCIDMNRPGSHDGAIRTRFDGEAAYRHDGVRFRDTDDLGIDRLFFSTFRGGDDPSWYVDQDAYIEFDDFWVVAAEDES